MFCHAVVSSPIRFVFKRIHRLVEHLMSSELGLTAEPCARPSTDPSKKTTALRVTSKQGEGTKDERRCHQQANRGQDEAADNFRVCAPAHASAPWLTEVPLSAVPVSPRLRNLWTFGS